MTYAEAPYCTKPRKAQTPLCSPNIILSTANEATGMMVKDLKEKYANHTKRKGIHKKDKAKRCSKVQKKYNGTEEVRSKVRLRAVQGTKKACGSSGDERDVLPTARWRDARDGRALLRKTQYERGDRGDAAEALVELSLPRSVLTCNPWGVPI